jgi:16S rRNA (guanine527-N7)-methyltransferase
VSRGLDAYATLVRKWAPRLDLVSPADLERFEERHIRDSLRALPLLEGLPDGDAVDVGSGAGLPGIPLALVGRPRRWRLLEPRRRRAAFLEECVRALDLDCEVVALSAQEAARAPGLAAAHVCALGRALASPSSTFALLMPLLAPDGTAVAFLGRDAKVPPGAALWREGLAIMRREGGNESNA